MMSPCLFSPPRVSPESRELLVAAETADPLDLLDHLDSLDLQGSLAERSESGQHTACVCVCVSGFTPATLYLVYSYPTMTETVWSRLKFTAVCVVYICIVFTPYNQCVLSEQGSLCS